MLKLLFVLLVSVSGVAQAPPSLNTMLDDSAYVFNRYDELVGTFNCSTLTGSDQSFRETCKGLISAVGPNVAKAKERLSMMRRAKTPALSDEFYIYTELEEVGDTETEISWWVGDFASDTTSAVTFAESGAKAVKLAAHLAVFVHDRIVLYEQSCTQVR